MLELSNSSFVPDLRDIFRPFQDGMGKLRIVKDGIRIEGSTEFVKSVYTSKIRSSGVSVNSLHLICSRTSNHINYLLYK